MGIIKQFRRKIKQIPGRWMCRICGKVGISIDCGKQPYCECGAKLSKPGRLVFRNTPSENDLVCDIVFAAYQSGLLFQTEVRCVFERKHGSKRRTGRLDIVLFTADGELLRIIEVKKNRDAYPVYIDQAIDYSLFGNVDLVCGKFAAEWYILNKFFLDNIQQHPVRLYCGKNGREVPIENLATSPKPLVAVEPAVVERTVLIPDFDDLTPPWD